MRHWKGAGAWLFMHVQCTFMLRVCNGHVKKHGAVIRCAAYEPEAMAAVVEMRWLGERYFFDRS